MLPCLRTSPRVILALSLQTHSKSGGQSLVHRLLWISTAVISLNYRDAIFYIVLAGVNLRLRLSKFAVVLSAVRQTNVNRCQQSASRFTADGPNLSRFPSTHFRQSPQQLCQRSYGQSLNSRMEPRGYSAGLPRRNGLKSGINPRVDLSGLKTRERCCMKSANNAVKAGRAFHQLSSSRVDGRRLELSPPMDNTRLKRLATTTHPPFHSHISLFDFSAKRSVHPPLFTRMKSFLALPLPLEVFGVIVSLTEGFTGGSFFEVGEEVKDSGLYAWPSMTFPMPR